jgi:hypothetical protein
VVGDGVAEVGRGVSHALHLATVVTHLEVSLDKVAKCGVEVKHARFAVANELVLDRAPDLAHDDAMLLGDVRKLAGDRAKDPGEDDSVHAILGRAIDKKSVGEDMVAKFVAL